MSSQRRQTPSCCWQKQQRPMHGRRLPRCEGRGYLGTAQSTSTTTSTSTRSTTSTVCSLPACVPSAYACASVPAQQTSASCHVLLLLLWLLLSYPQPNKQRATNAKHPHAVLLSRGEQLDLELQRKRAALALQVWGTKCDMCVPTTAYCVSSRSSSCACGLHKLAACLCSDRNSAQLSSVISPAMAGDSRTA
jgi:hypothetical protein